MSNKVFIPDPPTIVTITKGRTKARYETWRYWEIVGELRWAGMEIFDSYAAARWAARAKPGETKKIGEIKMEVSKSES